MTNDQEMRLHDEGFVDKKVQELMSHFDAAQIFVTRQEPDGRTMAYSTGKGNFYSRWGVIHEWIARGGGMDDSVPEGPEQGGGDPPAEEV